MAIATTLFYDGGETVTRKMELQFSCKVVKEKKKILCVLSCAVDYDNGGILLW